MVRESEVSCAASEPAMCLGPCDCHADPSAKKCAAVRVEKCLRRFPSPPSPNPRGSVKIRLLRASLRSADLVLTWRRTPCAAFVFGHRAHCKAALEPFAAAAVRRHALCASAIPATFSCRALRLRVLMVSDIVRIFCAAQSAGVGQSVFSRER